jgi:hypothetical protein
VTVVPPDEDLKRLDLENFYRHVLDGAADDLDDAAFALHLEAAVDSWFGVAVEGDRRSGGSPFG